MRLRCTRYKRFSITTGGSRAPGRRTASRRGSGLRRRQWSRRSGGGGGEWSEGVWRVGRVARAAAYGYIQPVRMNVLGLPFYSALLLPFVFQVVGTSFWNSLATMSARRFVMCGGVASAGIAIVWSDYATAWTPLWPHAIP